MKKSVFSGNSGAARTLVAVIVTGIVCALLVMPAAAMVQEYKENKQLWDQFITQSRNEHARWVDSFPEPPYITDNPANPGTYRGTCPVGTGGAPQLRDTKLSSGALCRGACGIDCPEERCRPIGEKTIGVNGGYCTYNNVVSCNSHEGCRDHDACYDYCTEKQGDRSVLLGECHGLCNQRCYNEYGIWTCTRWAGLPGIASSTASLMVDVVTSPPYDDPLLFSDEPVFTPSTETYISPVTTSQCDPNDPYGENACVVPVKR